MSQLQSAADQIPSGGPLDWYCEALGWKLSLWLFLILLTGVVCTWRVRLRARERRYHTLLANVLVLVTLPAWLGIAISGVVFCDEFLLETSSYPHGPIPDEAYARPWAYALIPLHVGMIVSLPGYCLAMGILCRRAFRGLNGAC